MKSATYIIVALGSGAVALPGPVSRRWDQQETANGRRSLTHWLAAGTCYIIPHSWCSPKITSAAIEPTAVADAEPPSNTSVAPSAAATTDVAEPQPRTVQAGEQRLPWVPRPSKWVIRANDCPNNVVQLLTAEHIVAISDKCGTGIACRAASDPAACFDRFEAPPNHPTELLDWQEGTYKPVLGSVGQCQYAPWIAFYPDVLCGTARHCKSYHIGYMNDDMYRNEQDCLDSHRPAPN